jgi:hypothetical protein
MFPNDDFVNEIRNKYPRGSRIQLDYMDDPERSRPEQKEP